MRRCFQLRDWHLLLDTVFSAHAEMFPIDCLLQYLRGCILRACGDVSEYGYPSVYRKQYSPRMRRCFYPKYRRNVPDTVFSAHAEMFLSFVVLILVLLCILRACGDVSEYGYPSVYRKQYSPRMRRCFFYSPDFRLFLWVFSAHAEMFLSVEY